MQSEFARRKEAVQLYYYQNLTKSVIQKRLQCTANWLNRWLSRYDPDDVDGSLRNQRPGPRRVDSRWSLAIRQQVVEMRKARNSGALGPYALIGAAAIHYELKALKSPEIPPIRTIHRWLSQAGLIHPASRETEERESKVIPLPAATAVNQVQQLDLKGPIYLQGSGHKYYLVSIRDRYSRRCAIDALASRKAQGIVDFLVASWHWLGVPDYLQLDNALEFRGSNRYPRSFGRLVRVALDLDIEPVFNPPYEPWRNGCVERHNGFLDERLLAVECADFDALQQEARACQRACNQTHRLTVLEGHTPNEVAQTATLRLLSPNYQRHQAQRLPQNLGWVSFVRLVRKSGRITLGAGDRFMVDPELAYTYVLARVDMTNQIVTISQEGEVLKTYDFSPDTVGQWADDESDEPVKELAPTANYGTSEH
jgi:putative transposase